MLHAHTSETYGQWLAMALAAHGPDFYWSHRIRFDVDMWANDRGAVLTNP